MVEVESGAIRIDGVDISTIHIKDLRAGLAVIPQDPVIFTGSYRFNLDAYNARTDAEVRDVLRSVRMGALADVDLDSPIEELSQGEKQLLSIARALLRNTRILVAGAVICAQCYCID